MFAKFLLKVKIHKFEKDRNYKFEGKYKSVPTLKVSESTHIHSKNSLIQIFQSDLRKLHNILGKLSYLFA